MAAGGSQARLIGPAAHSHSRGLQASGTTITAKQHEGQRSDGTYTSGNITQYKEGDTINFHFDLTSSDAATDATMQVRFTGDDGTCLFFDNYFALGSIDNVSGDNPAVTVKDGPTADSFGTSGGEWVVTLGIDFPAAGEAIVNYQLKLSPHAGECNGSSQHSRLQPGDLVSQTGQQNVPVPANQVIEFPSITVVKQVDRGTGTYVTASAGEYCFTIDGGANACTDANGQVVFDSSLQLADGNHTITESSEAGYGFDHGTGTNCSFSGSTATAAIAAGTTPTNATCTFFNKLLPAPTVTVTKSCPNGTANAGDQFQITDNGSNAGSPLSCGGSVVVNVTPGQAYTIDEAAANGADLANYTKTKSNTGCSGTLINGQTASCTITNTLNAQPTVTVTKSCPNSAANSGDRFQITNNGAAAGDPIACDGHVDVQVAVGAAYSMDEKAAATTDLANYNELVGTHCTGTLARYGDTASCTITNTLKAAPKVTVTKDCPAGAAHDGDLFQVTNNGDNAGDPLACGDHVDVVVGAGTAYSIDEAAAGTTKLSDYVETRGQTCNGTLAHYGDTAVCTITNTLKDAPVVTVTKSCTNGAPANTGDRFEALVDGSSTDPKTVLACGDSAQVTVAPDTGYSITEQAGNNTTSLDNYNVSYGNGCSSDGLARGSTDTICTITNELKPDPKVTVTKLCPNDTAGQGDRFQVKLGGTDVGDALACDGHVDVSVTPGQRYDITEGAAGTTDLANYDATLDEGCSGTLAHYGDTADCTITNTLKAEPILIVVKNVINDDGGKAKAPNFNLSVTGSSPTPASFPGDAGGTVVTLLPGAYSVHEAAAAGYATSMDAGCTGTLAHYGDKATCTVTNNDTAVPPPPPPPPPAPNPRINMRIIKSAAPNPATVGGNLTYTLKVTNLGPNQANDVVVTDSLPSETTFVSVSTNKGTCTGTNAISCSLGQVAVGEFITITIVVKPTQAGTITNTTVVAGHESEVDPSDNTSSATVTVNGPFTPPSACYALTVRPRSLTVGNRTVVHVSVRQLGKGIGGVRVVIVGKGINKAAATNARGVATFVIKSGKPGILQIRVPTHATCRKQRIGVIGVFTPPVTG